MKSILSLLLLVSMILLFACQKENTSPSPDLQPGADSTNIENINAPDGFNFESSQVVSFQLTTVDAAGDVVEKVLIKILGVNEENQAEQFYSSISNEVGLLNIELKVANHYQSIQIITDYQGLEKSNTFEITESIESSLRVN